MSLSLWIGVFFFKSLKEILWQIKEFMVKKERSEILFTIHKQKVCFAISNWAFLVEQL